MTLTLAEYVKAGFELAPEDRMEASRLLATADDEDVQLSAEWLDEIDARIDAIESGEVELLDADESHARIVAGLMSKR